MKIIQDIITAARNIRGEMNIPPQKASNLIIVSSNGEKSRTIDVNSQYIQKLARVDKILFHDSFNSSEVAASAVFPGLEIYMPLKDLIDIDVEKNRLEKEMLRLENQIKSIKANLENPDFIGKAPAQVIEKQRAKGQDFEETYQKIKSNYDMLTGRISRGKNG